MFGSGSNNAKIAIIEDFPWQVEYLNKKLYLGGSGYTYQTILAAAGLKREEIWTTSYLGSYAKNLKEYFYDKTCTKLKYEYNDYANKLVQELLQLPNLKIIIPVGNASLQVIAGVKGLSNWRGSVISITDEFCRAKKDTWKVIPTYSPRDINTDYHLKVYTTLDLKKAIRQKDIKGIVKPVRRIIVEPTFEQAKKYLEDIIRYKKRCAADIETKGSGWNTIIDCISFAISSSDGISIPFYHTNMNRYWKNIHESNVIESLVRQIINDPNIPKIYQNGMYDTWVMANLGYDPKGLAFDTMYAAHCMYCELEKDLGTLTSIYTDEPYYKFERLLAKKELAKVIKPIEKDVKKRLSEARKSAKKRATALRRIKRTTPLKSTPKRLADLEKWHVEKGELHHKVKELMNTYRSNKIMLNMEKEKFDHNADITRWIYNTKDSLVTKEISEKQEVILKEMGLWDFFNKYYIAMFPFAFDISMKGIKIDEEHRKVVADQVHKGLEGMRQEIYNKVGYEFNTESSQQLCKVLYETLNLPVQMKKGRVTTDAKALEKLIEKTNNPVLEDIVDIRKLAKLESTYLTSKLDNGHLRSEMVIAHTTSGRFASRKTPFGTGGNLQNIPSGKTEVSDRVLKALNYDKSIIKTCFIPESDDYIFIEVDLSNADTWFTAFKAKDEVLMDALVSGKDTHKIVGSICYQISEDEIDDIKRAKSKRIGHGFNYGMMEKTMAADTKLPLSLVIEMYKRLKETRPAIPEYHKEVERCIIEYHCLVNAWGRKRIFFDRTPYKWKNNQKVALFDEVYRSGYSYIPQSSVADTIGEIVIRFNKANKDKTRIRGALQVHDSLLIHCLKRAFFDAIALLWECFDITQNPWGDPFRIPWDYAIGHNWGRMCKLPVKDGIIDYAKSTVEDKKTGIISEAPWVKIVEEIKNRPKLIYI